MSKCYLNGKEYQINANLIKNYTNTWSHKFSKEESDAIMQNVCSRLEGVNVRGIDIQGFNSLEDAYTDAACCYVFTHDNSVEALLLEKDNDEVFGYMGMGKPEGEPEYEDERSDMR